MLQYKRPLNQYLNTGFYVIQVIYHTYISINILYSIICDLLKSSLYSP